MAQGNQIIITTPHHGVHLEGIINGTDKPGTCMEIDLAIASVGGRHQWEAFGLTAAGVGQGVSADGEQRLVVVLIEDDLQSKIATDAYVSGDRCFLYCPAPGEDMNILAKDITGTGTGDEWGIGDLGIIDDGTGKLVRTTGSPESEPFFAMQAITDVTADTLLWCKFTGY